MTYLESVKDSIFYLIERYAILTAQDYKHALKLCQFAEIDLEFLDLRDMPDSELADAFDINDRYETSMVQVIKELKERAQSRIYEWS